jgi:hypothetical protein
MLMCHKVKNTLRTCAPRMYGCGNDPVTCANNKASGLTVTVTGGVEVDGIVTPHRVVPPTTVSATPEAELTPHFAIPLGWGCSHDIPAEPSAIDKDYLRALHRFCFLMGQRFGEKEAQGKTGWNDNLRAEEHVEKLMADVVKIDDLCGPPTEEFSKLCLDVANRALFLWNMARPRDRGEAVGG